MAVNEKTDGYDVLVLGAGIIGVSTALHLVKRGQRVCLVDKQEPGLGTSYGNAGLIERSAVIPYAFPYDFMRTVRYALNQQPDVHYHWGTLLRMSGWLWRFWRNSAPKKLEQAARDMLPLIERSVTEHAPLLKEADLESYVRKGGWIDVYRRAKDMAEAKEEVRALAPYNLQFEVLDTAALREREPGVTSALVGGIHWQDPWTLEDPKAIVQGYADLYRRLGGDFCHGDARTLSRTDSGWQVTSRSGEPLRATQAVVALGPDCNKLLHLLDYHLPLAQKRGYHRHYQAQAETPELIHPICDSRGGYVLAPMRQGVRLTTGIEFAAPEAPVDWTQLHREYALASTIYPLGEPVEAEPWVGHRPCLPDMRPVIGKAPNHTGLWLNFGHNHHGITLGPVSGRLMAEMITGEAPCVDPSPYAATRF